MSRYTTEVRWIVESEAAAHPDRYVPNSVDDKIDIARRYIFNFDYPIWNEDYRSVLEHKILRHYYTREICAETVGLWKLWLNDKMNMIMPYYNQLYRSTELEFNPFYDVDVTTEHTRENEGETTGQTTSQSISNGTSSEDIDRTVNDDLVKSGDITRRGTGTVTDAGTGTIQDSGSTVSSSDNSNDWKLFSDTPQGGIVGVRNASIIQNSSLADYAYLTTAENDIHTGSTNVTGQGSNTRTRNTQDQQTRNTTDTETLNTTDARDISEDTSIDRETHDTTTGSGTSSGTMSSTEEFAERVFGKRGHHTYAYMLMEYRKSLLNIDAMIIEELKDLFFKLWD